MSTIPKIRLIFSNSYKPLSPIIRAVTWSEYSHVGMLIDDTTVIESTLSHGGVKLAPIDVFKQRASEWLIVELDVVVNDWDAIVKAAMNELNKPYDFFGIAGIGLHRDWQEDDRWFCSELIPYICMQGGTNLFNPKFVHRIVPQHLLMLPSKVIDASY